MSRYKEIVTFGATGLVGQAINPILADEFVLIDYSIDHPDLNKRVDLTDSNAFLEVFRRHSHCIAVLDLAAATDTSKAFADPGYRMQAYKINHQFPDYASYAFRCRKIPFFYIGSDFVYDGADTNPIDENHPTNPIEPYGKSKAFGEKAVLKNKGTVLTIAFPFTPNPTRFDLVSKFRDKLTSDQVVKVFDNQVITPTFVPDLAEIIIRLLKSPNIQPNQFLGQKFHCTGSTYRTPFLVASAIAEKYHLKPSLIQATSVTDYNDYARQHGLRPYQPHLALVNGRISKLTGFKPKTFEQGLNLIP